MTEYEVAAGGLMKCSVLISDLKPKQYSFRVRAFNELFCGEASRTLNVTPSVELIRSAARASFLEEYNTKVNYLNEKFFEYYTVSEVIGRGRFSLVKSAVCNTSQRRFVAKFLTRHPLRGVDLDEECIEKEIRSLYSLRHSNIVSLRAAVKTAHDFIIVMKWINGPPIMQYITRLGYVSEELIRRLCRDALAALDYMHAFNMAHLDIKVGIDVEGDLRVEEGDGPEDLLVHMSRHGARLVLIDFGSSRYCTPPTSAFKSPPTEFGSPEHHLYKPLTTKADIWSIGIILYVLVCGHLPFDDDDENMMRLSIISASIQIDGIARLELFSAALKSLLKSILILNSDDRPSAADCLQAEWMCREIAPEYLLVDYLEDYVEKREVRLRACCIHEDSGI
uniref:Protein kinase domain-containing protein n=1 Tax=Parascaris equorum TaxID=6256 RepID=A0A914RRI8_PAREQ